MAGEKFNLGDVVRLKSGGPLMTIGVDIRCEKVECVWMEPTNHQEVHSAFFHVQMLNKEDKEN
jgi:uncharacterized protein YodC (DUF2158 family)